MSGTEVIVLVEGVYNGPHHKALGLCTVGQRIRTASGAYTQSLLASGLVALPGREPVAPPSEPPPPVVENPSAPMTLESVSLQSEAVVEDTGYQALQEAGINKTVAKLVYDAGFRTKADIAATYDAYGTARLTEIPGVGLNSAIKLLRWAGIDPGAT